MPRMTCLAAILVLVGLRAAPAAAESWVCPYQIIPQVPPETVKYSVVGDKLVFSDRLDNSRKENNEAPISWTIILSNAHGIVAVDSRAEITDGLDSDGKKIGDPEPNMWVSTVAIDRDTGAFHWSEFHVEAATDKIHTGQCQRGE
jgi:hypothetical protein